MQANRKYAYSGIQFPFYISISVSITVGVAYGRYAKIMDAVVVVVTFVLAEETEWK